MRENKSEGGKMIWWSIEQGQGGVVTPSDPLPPMPDVPRGCLLVITGRAPIWRYGMAIHKAHGSPAGAVATYDPRLGVVVVMSHCPQWAEKQVIDI